MSVGSSTRRPASIAELSAVRPISAGPSVPRPVVAWSVASWSLAPGSVVAGPVPTGAIAARPVVPASFVERLSRLGRRSGIRLRGASLRTLSLEQPQRRGSQLGGVEFTEQGLERNHFARRYTLRQYRAQLFTHGFVAVACSSLRTVEVKRGEPSTGELSQPRNFARRRQCYDLHRLDGSDALQLGRRHRWLVENHRVGSRASELSTSDVDRLVVLMVTESAERLCRLAGRNLVTCDDDGRRRIQIVQQFPQSAGARAPRDGDVPDQRHFVISGNLRRFRLRRADASCPAGIALDEVFDLGVGFARDDYPARFSQLAHNAFG